MGAVALLHEDGARRFFAQHLLRPYLFASPFGSEDFALLLHACDAQITPAEQQALSAAIVAQGCRYAVCSGHECSSWDDSIDEAFLRNDPEGDPPDSRFVMTDWHDGEPLEEVAFSFLHCTAIDGAPPTRFLLVSLGGTDADADLLNAAVLGAIRDS